MKTSAKVLGYIFLTALSLSVAGGGCATGPGGGRRGALLGPKGAPWTILCVQLQEHNRAEHAEHIEQIAATLKRTPGIRAQEVFVRDGSDGSVGLYYGTYYRRTDPKTGRRAMPGPMRRDLDLLKQLGTDAGQRFFIQAMPVRMPTPDVGNPDWDLNKVNATYSLQVAVFEPNDDFWEFKQAAAQLCAFLRGKGYQAYYHHGPASSVVTVGAFGPQAVVTGSDGRTYYSPQVLALQREELLKYNLVNGAKIRVKDSEGGGVIVPSRLVEIPKTR